MPRHDAPVDVTGAVEPAAGQAAAMVMVNHAEVINPPWSWANTWTRYDGCGSVTRASLPTTVTLPSRPLGEGATKGRPR